MDASGVSSFRVEIEDYLGKVEKAISDELDNYKDSMFFSPLSFATKGDGRIRPVMLILAYESVGGTGSPDPMSAAVAVELAHTESLVHDDIIGKDSLRHGSTAFHVLYGWGLSALSADFILSMILDIAARYSDARVTRTLAFGARRMCEGELEKLEVQNTNESVNLDKFIDILEKKTFSLFEVSAKIGAIIGGGSDEEIEALSEYGRLVGVACQIQDVILNWESNPLVKLAKVSKANLDKAITIENLEKLSQSRITETKLKLEKLKASKARNLLEKLADFAVLSHHYMQGISFKSLSES